MFCPDPDTDPARSPHALPCFRDDHRHTPHALPDFCTVFAGGATCLVQSLGCDDPADTYLSQLLSVSMPWTTYLTQILRKTKSRSHTPCPTLERLDDLLTTYLTQLLGSTFPRTHIPYPTPGFGSIFGPHTLPNSWVPVRLLPHTLPNSWAKTLNVAPHTLPNSWTERIRRPHTLPNSWDLPQDGFRI